MEFKIDCLSRIRIRVILFTECAEEELHWKMMNVCLTSLGNGYMLTTNRSTTRYTIICRLVKSRNLFLNLRLVLISHCNKRAKARA